MKILLVEDEPKIVDFVSTGLTARGMQLTCCGDGVSGQALAQQGGFEVIVLDIMLPGRDGLAVLSALRRAGVQTPVILLTARNELGDRVQGLELGADDYLAKPFFVEELAARIRALQRRLPGERQHFMQSGALTLDRIGRQAQRQGRVAELTSREFNLLEMLMRSPGQVFTRHQILEHVWGHDFDPGTNVVDVCVMRIRAKLATLLDDAASPIEAVRGTGYRWREP